MTDATLKPTVFVVDDDDAIRDSMSMLLKTVGLQCETYPSAKDFLDAYDHDRPGCLVLDIRMPGMSGMELQELLNERHAITPIVFITGHGDVPMAVEAMQGGAVDFIQKPFRDQDLIDRINTALEGDRQLREELGEKQELMRRYETLTPREQEVLALVAKGHANKVAAYELGVSQRTIEIHRARVMEKMQARSLAQLVRMQLSLG